MGLKVISEKSRGCGQRSIGGLYLVGEGFPVVCDGLPYNIHVCPTCGNGVKFSRSIQWVRAEYFRPPVKCTVSCKMPDNCPFPRDKVTEVLSDVFGVEYALMWVGEKYYSPISFIREARELGVSKRIAQIPKKLKLNETWILLAHKQAGVAVSPDGVVKVPAIFYAFRATRIEKLLTEEMATEEELDKCQKRNITPVVFKDWEVEQSKKKGE